MRYATWGLKVVGGLGLFGRVGISGGRVCGVI